MSQSLNAARSILKSFSYKRGAEGSFNQEAISIKHQKSGFYFKVSDYPLRGLGQTIRQGNKACNVFID